MVLLTTAAVFAALSIILFVAGLALQRPEIAMFGAVIMIGVGGMGVAQGYQVESGEVQTETFNETTNTTTTEVEMQYEDVDSIANFPLELLIVLLGAVMLMSGAGEASEEGT